MCLHFLKETNIEAAQSKQAKRLILDHRLFVVRSVATCTNDLMQKKRKGNIWVSIKDEVLTSKKNTYINSR